MRCLLCTLDQCLAIGQTKRKDELMITDHYNKLTHHPHHHFLLVMAPRVETSSEPFELFFRHNVYVLALRSADLQYFRHDSLPSDWSFGVHAYFLKIYHSLILFNNANSYWLSMRDYLFRNIFVDFFSSWAFISFTQRIRLIHDFSNQFPYHKDFDWRFLLLFLEIAVHNLSKLQCEILIQLAFVKFTCKKTKTKQ